MSTNGVPIAAVIVAVALSIWARRHGYFSPFTWLLYHKRDRSRCPECREVVHPDAVKCPHCQSKIAGRTISGRPPKPPSARSRS